MYLSSMRSGISIASLNDLGRSAMRVNDNILCVFKGGATIVIIKLYFMTARISAYL